MLFPVLTSATLAQTVSPWLKVVWLVEQSDFMIAMTAEVTGPSVNVVCACNPEVPPVAVRVNLMSTSCESGEN